MSNDKSPWLPAIEITGDARAVLVPHDEHIFEKRWYNGNGWIDLTREPEAYMEMPPRYVPEPLPKWGWQDGKFSPAEGVMFHITVDRGRYDWRGNLPGATYAVAMIGHVTTEREAKLAAEEWWENLKELTK
jgi:hypothetical protein